MTFCMRSCNLCRTNTVFCDFFQCRKCKVQLKNYSKHMGGVDLGDMMISLYRTPFKAKRYYLRIFAHMLDLICKMFVLIKQRTGQFTQVKEDAETALLVGQE